MQTDAATYYHLQHIITKRWVAKLRAAFIWHGVRARAVAVKGGPGLDAFLAARDVVLVAGRPERGCDIVATPAKARSPARKLIPKGTLANPTPDFTW